MSVVADQFFAGLRVVHNGKRAEIELCRAISDADLAQNLERFPLITALEVDLEGAQRSDWNNLLHVIAMKANLEKVELMDAENEEERTAPAALVQAFLQSIQRNTSIQCMHLMWLRLPNNGFVENASSITTLTLWSCSAEPAERELVATDFTAALRRNTNIKSLRFFKMDDDIFFSNLLQGLGNSAYLKTLSIENTAISSDAASSGMQHLLESKTSIKRLELTTLTFCTRLLRRIAPSIIESQSVSELKFENCTYDGSEESIVLLRNVFLNKRNLTSLSILRCSFAGELFNQDFIATLSRADFLLRCFEFEASLLEDCFEALLKAIAKSRLERIKIIAIFYHHQTLLTTIIPMLKVKELEMQLHCLFFDGSWAHALLQAIKKNFSLRAVTAEWQGESIFNEDDKLRLQFYADRNERLDRWVVHPEKVDRKVWPETLQLADEAGPDFLFRGLRSVLESDYVSLRGGRKRKRPQYYAPS